MILLLVFLRGFLRRIAILLAVVFGWVAAWLMDLLNIAPAARPTRASRPRPDRLADAPTPGGNIVTLGEADWIGLPDFTAPSFSFTRILLVLPVVIALIAENTGHVKAVAEMTGADLDP